MDPWYLVLSIKTQIWCFSKWPVLYFKMFSWNRNDFGTSGTILGLLSTVHVDVLDILGQVAQS